MSHQKMDVVDNRYEIGRALLRTDVDKIVKTFLENPVLCKNWKSLYRSLNLDESKIQQWDTMITIMAKTMQDLFKEMMDEWIAPQGDSAMLSGLCSILIRENNKLAADNLITAFGQDNR